METKRKDVKNQLYSKKNNHVKNYQETTVKGPQKNQFPIAVLELTASLCINHYLFTTPSDCFVHFYNRKINKLTENKLYKRSENECS